MSKYLELEKIRAGAERVPAHVKIPGYEIVREIGRGAMSTVYLAIRESLERPVALKILSPSLTADPSFQERFLKEGRIIAKLTHPHIVTVHDIGRYEDRFYMDLEYAGGGSLAVPASEGISENEAVRLTIEVAEALSFAHKRDFVHRDIKPGNILFREDGTALLSDFGIAKALSGDGNLTGVGLAIGTPSYMSPEQASGKPITTQTDIYSLGVTFYEMLTGSKPYVGDDSIAIAIKHINEPVPVLPSRFAHFQAVVDLCMAKSPLERYASCDELIRDLQMASVNSDTTVVRSAQSAATVVARPDTGTLEKPPGGVTQSRTEDAAGSAKPGSSMARRLGLGLTVLVLALSGAGGYWFWQHQLGERAGRSVDLAALNVPIELPEARLRKQADILLGVGREYQELSQQSELDGEDAALIEEVAGELAGLIALADAAGEDALTASLMEDALAVAPRADSLVQLRDKLRQSASERSLSAADRLRVEGLLADAESHVRAMRYTLPAGRNALDSYRSVLTIDPGNAEVLARLEKLASVFLQQAESDIGRGAYADAGANVEVGLMLDPTHAGLRKLSARFQPSARP